MVVVTPREEYRLRVFHNMYGAGGGEIVGIKREEVTRDWRKLHDEELHDQYCSPNIIRVMKIEKNEMGGTFGTFGIRVACRVLPGNPE